MEIQGLESLQAILQEKLKDAQGASATVLVGFTAGYGVYVHENLEAKHPVGQAKFLEEPARTFAGEIGNIVGEAIKKGATMAQALLLGGLRLQREAQLLTPVDTGNLRASAFTRLEQ